MALECNSPNKDRANGLRNISSIARKTSEKKVSKKWTVKSVEEFKANRNNEIVFSFMFYDRVHKAFNLGGLEHVCDHWFVELLDCLKEVSNRNWGQLVTIPRFRAHPHKFSETNFEYEMFDEETLKQLDCVQFSISKSYGRVHGFLIDNCFYIYWLDPHHNMYDADGYGGVREYAPIKSCYEILNEHNILLAEENEKLRAKINYIEQNMDKDSYELLEELIQAEEEIKSLKKARG